MTMTSDFTMESAADSMYSSLKPPSFHSLFNLACQDSELEAKLRETSSLASNEESKKTRSIQFSPRRVPNFLKSYCRPAGSLLYETSFAAK